MTYPQAQGYADDVRYCDKVRVGLSHPAHDYAYTDGDISGRYWCTGQAEPTEPWPTRPFAETPAEPTQTRCQRCLNGSHTLCVGWVSVLDPEYDGLCTCGCPTSTTLRFEVQNADPTAAAKFAPIIQRLRDLAVDPQNPVPEPPPNPGL